MADAKQNDEDRAPSPNRQLDNFVYEDQLYADDEMLGPKDTTIESEFILKVKRKRIEKTSQ